MHTNAQTTNSNADAPAAPETDEAIAQRAADAQAQAEQLNAAADDADRLASEAADKFAAEPTAATVMARDVQRQRAINARAKAVAAGEQAEALAAESDRRAKMRRLLELRPRANANVVRQAAHERAVSLARELLATVQAECDQLVEAMNARDVAAAEFASLADELGVDIEPGEHAAPMLIDAMIAGLRDLLRKTFGGRVDLSAVEDDMPGSRVLRLSIDPLVARIFRDADWEARVRAIESMSVRPRRRVERND